jgi:hypothetical protein
VARELKRKERENAGGIARVRCARALRAWFLPASNEPRARRVDRPLQAQLRALVRLAKGVES